MQASAAWSEMQVCVLAGASDGAHAAYAQRTCCNGHFHVTRIQRRGTKQQYVLCSLKAIANASADYNSIAEVWLVGSGPSA